MQVLEEEQGITLITRGLEGVPQEGLSLPVLLLSQLGVGRSDYVHAQIHAGGGFRPKLLARYTQKIGKHRLLTVRECCIIFSTRSVACHIPINTFRTFSASDLIFWQAIQALEKLWRESLG